VDSHRWFHLHSADASRSKYLSWHIRRQLAFDIWPLTLAIFLIACAERGKLMDPNKSPWFTIFRIIFECTSAYSTIGLSLGTPNNNYSFAGEFGTVSKLIVSEEAEARIWADNTGLGDLGHVARLETCFDVCEQEELMYHNARSSSRLAGSD